jgi:hypothetical protein
MAHEVIPTKDDVAIALAQAHYEGQPGLQAIYRLMRADDENDPQEPIKLLEVNEDTVAVGIQPVSFGPHPASGVHYPSVIVEVTPEEFQQIQQHELALPHDWRIGQPYARPA